IGASLPYAKHLYCISQYANDGIQIQTLQGEYDEKYPKTLAHFLKRGNTGWYALSETPFSNKKSIGQTSLEMELDRDYLFLKGFKTENAELYLLIQLKPYGPNKNKYLLSDQKKQFELTIKGFVSQLLEIIAQDKSVLKNIAKSNMISRNESKETRALLSKQSQNFEIAVAQFIQLIINKLENKYNIKIRMSHDFIDAIKEYDAHFENLEPNLDKHIQIELNLALAQGQEEILLTPSHLVNLGSTKATIRQESQTDTDNNLGRLAKTYKLLDRYETAAENARSKGLSIIGKNIGNNCSPPVSNASITDALNKQAKKVYELFAKYPAKWPIIRSEFKSVANIIEKETIRRQKIA
ncbi:MAG: hypothetical protein ACPGTP_08775, partial [Bacteroidia bacterium]